MKLTPVAIACGLALNILTTEAAGPVIPGGTKTIMIAGASSADVFIDTVASSMLINTSPSSITRIRSNDSATAPEHHALLGSANVSEIAPTQNILLIKRSADGSSMGVNAIARASRIKTLDLNNCVSQTPTTADPYSWRCATKGTDPWVTGHNNSANTGSIPDIGLSYSEPNQYSGPYNTGGSGTDVGLTNSERTRLSAKPVNLVLMGLVATDAVSQNAHLSRSKYGAMLSGRIPDWYDIDGTTDPVVVCRRTSGSGTQAVFTTKFSGFPCNSASLGFTSSAPANVADSFGYDVTGGSGTSASPIVIDPSAGYTVVENSTSDDVIGCMKAAQNGTDFVVKGGLDKIYLIQFSNVGGPSKAIGVLSLESYHKASPNVSNAGFSFRQLDGAGIFDGVSQTVTSGPGTGMSPSKVNLLNGDYDFVAEMSVQIRNASVTNVNGDVVAPITTDPIKNTFYNELVTRLGSTKFTGNDGAIVNLVPNAYASLPSRVSYALKPDFVSKYTINGNTCSPFVKYPPL